MAAAAARRLLRPLAARQLLRGFASEAAASPDAAWFVGKGLSFECTRCGKCCTGHRRAVYVSEVEAEVRFHPVEHGICALCCKLEGSFWRLQSLSVCSDTHTNAAGSAELAWHATGRVPQRPPTPHRRPSRAEAICGHRELHLPAGRAPPPLGPNDHRHSHTGCKTVSHPTRLCC